MTALISVLIACKNAASFLDAAMESVRGQSHDALDIVVIDDGSSDNSREIAHFHAAQDARVRVATNAGYGVAAARNTGLALARGEYVAIVDADDLIHADRFSRLLDLSRGRGADMVADNQILFISGRSDIAPWLFITHPDWAGSRDIDLETFLTSSLRGARARDLGYLKPLIRRAAIGELRYDESLTIGEDQDFYARALLNGARFVYTPDAYYCYRRHAQSTSYRLRTDDLDAMIAAEQAFRPKLLSDRVRAISLKRGRQMAIERSTVAAIEAIKRRDALAAVGHIAEHPSAVLRLSEVIGEAVRKRLAPEKTYGGPRAGGPLEPMQKKLDQAFAALNGESVTSALGGYDLLMRACFARAHR